MAAAQAQADATPEPTPAVDLADIAQAELPRALQAVATDTELDEMGDSTCESLRGGLTVEGVVAELDDADAAQTVRALAGA